MKFHYFENRDPDSTETDLFNQKIFCKLFYTVLAFDCVLSLLEGNDHILLISHADWIPVSVIRTRKLFHLLLIVDCILDLISEYEFYRRLRICFYYNVAYFIDMHDMYAHHYLLAVLLWIFISFSGNKDSLWAMKLTRIMMGIVYFFTAVTKMDHEFLSGRVLPFLSSNIYLHDFLHTVSIITGVSDNELWRLASIMTVICEMYLALSWIYLSGVFSFDKPNIFDKFIFRKFNCITAGLSLHAVISILNLHIRLFSIYMFLFYILISPKIFRNLLSRFFPD